MNRVTEPGTVRAEAVHCAYCDGPLPADSPVPSPAQSQRRYCCYGCRILGETSHQPVGLTPTRASPWFRIAVGAVLAGQGMLLDLAVNLTPPEGAARGFLHAALIVSCAGVLALLGGPLLRSALEEVRQRRVTLELLFLAGIAGALGASLSSTWRGTGAVYYEVVAVLLTVYSVGKTLGAQSRARAWAETHRLHQTFDTCEQLAPDGSATVVPVARVVPGDQVRVRAGQPIPVDGRIVAGQAFVCETPLTGEPYPVVRCPGDAVLAGSYSEDGELRVTATVAGTDRRLDGLLAALNSARESPCRVQAHADRLVAWFLPLVIGVSLVTFAFWTWRTGWPTGLYNALAVLLVACPCALGLATPVALWSGLATLAARGLVLRGGDEIERLATLDTMVFDKTGTLSEEQFSLLDLVVAGDPEPTARQTLLGQLHAVQSASAHPVARAFQGLASLSDPSDLSDSPKSAFHLRSLKTVPARGLEAWLESAAGPEHHLRVGQRELMSDLRAEAELLARLRPSASGHLVYVEVDGRLRAIAAVRERLRDSARATLEALERQGVACAVMSGDRPERAARLLGREDIQGNLTPQDKAARIAALLRAGHRVGFVGDGVNDAPALREASVGLALAHGAGVTTAWAGAVLYGGDLRVLPWAVALSRRVRDSIRSNLILAAAYNLVGMALAATGLLHPVVAALLMVVSSFTVSWRALRGATDDPACCPGLSLDHQQARPLPIVPARETGRASVLECGRPLPLSPDTSRSPAAAPLDPASIQPKRQRTGALQKLAPFPDPAPHPSLSDRSRPRPLSQLVASLLVLAQAPFLLYLGQLRGGTALGTFLGLLALALFILLFRTQHPERARVARMLFAMLGLGNWGMILGWWADAGFGPVVAACPHCAQHGASLWSLTAMPWMNLGMLLFGLPPMLTGPGHWRPRLILGFCSALGMMWGMSLGGHAALQALGPALAQPFLLSFAGMTLGMLAGMLLGCEFGRAVLRALPPTRAA